MPTRPATDTDLEMADGPSIDGLPFDIRMMAEMAMIAQVAGLDEVDGFEKSDLIACQIRQILAL